MDTARQDDSPPPQPALLRPYVTPRPEASVRDAPAAGDPPPATPTDLPPATPAPAAAGESTRTRRPPAEPSGLRPYLLTGGRAKPALAALELEAQVNMTEAGAAATDRLTYELRDILLLCNQPMALAELAARLGLQIGVVRVLVGDLVGIGYLTVRRPAADLHRDVRIVERVIRGLKSI